MSECNNSLLMLPYQYDERVAVREGDAEELGGVGVCCIVKRIVIHCINSDTRVDRRVVLEYAGCGSVNGCI